MASKTPPQILKRATTIRIPGWVWMLFGLAIGLSVAAAVYVKDRHHARVASSAARVREPRARPRDLENASTTTANP